MAQRTPLDPPPTPTLKVVRPTRRVYTDLVSAWRGAADDRVWFAEGAIERTPVALFVAPEKSGKSWVLLDLIRAVALGGKWCGNFTITSPGPVMVVDTENGGEETARRLARLARGVGRNPEDLLRRVMHDEGHGLSLLGDDAPAALGALAADAGDAGVKLIVIDPLRGVLGDAHENDTTDIQRALTGASTLRKQVGCPVIIAHHVNRSGTYAGARSLRTRADLIFEAGDDDPRRYRATGRTLREGDPIAKGLVVEVRHEHDDDDSKATTIVAARIGEQSTARSELSVVPRRMLDALREQMTPMTFADLRRAAKATSGGATKKAIDELLNAKRIQKIEDGRYSLPTNAFFDALGGRS